MASPTYQPDSPVSFPPPQAQFDPTESRSPLLDGDWWPSSTDLEAELRVLLPFLDHLRGQVKRLLLGVERWAARPHQIIMGDRTVTIGYLAGQPASVMTVICADGVTFTVRVVPPGLAPGSSDRPETRLDKDLGHHATKAAAPPTQG